MNFLLEIGTEEIPDWMIPGALEFLGARFAEILPGVRTDATSRRLTVRASEVIEKEADREEWVMGPSASAPAQAVAGFAKKQGVAAETLVQRTTMWRYSPCSGTKKRGRHRDSICSCSSLKPWPELWTRAVSSPMISAPERNRALIISPMARSLPGMRRDDMITRSPGDTLTFL